MIAVPIGLGLLLVFCFLIALMSEAYRHLKDKWWF